MGETDQGDGRSDSRGELFPSPDQARFPKAAPVGSARRRGLKRIVLPLIDLGLRARQRVRGLGGVMDRAANGTPPQQLLVLGIYKPEGAADMARAVSAMRRSRHWVRVALGAIGQADPALAEETLAEDMAGGKFANLNRVLALAGLEDAGWIVILDDDVRLPRRFCDRLIAVAERARLQLAQPALSWRSDAAWQVVRRRPFLLRITHFVEIGPVTLMSREVLDALLPFPEDGMGWGLELHWGALAQQRGWRLAVIDALAVRHEARATASGYDPSEAMAAARRFLDTHEHLSRTEAESVVENWGTLPARSGGGDGSAGT
jgi:hypothetical protein